MGVSGWVRGWAQSKPSRPALLFEDRCLTWRQLDDHATDLAGALLQLGVRPGDRVACLLPNRLEFVEVFVAVLRVGAVFVPLNSLAPAGELLALIEDCDARLVVTDQSYSAVVEQMAALGGTRAFASVEGPLPGPHSRIDEVASGTTGVDPALGREGKGSDLACIYYTSGTTGGPKGALITHDNIHYATLNWLVDLGFWQDDRFLLNLPLCFTGAMAIVAPALHGGITVRLERSFDAGRTLELIESDRITFMVAVPTMALAMMRHPDFEVRDLSSLRMILSGAAPVPMTLFEVWTARGVPFISSFGMTEVAGGFAMITPVAEAADRLGSAGRPCLYAEARVVSEDGRNCEDDEVGELLLRGPLVCQGYWHRPAETASTIVDGWLHTGDLARRNADGYYYVVDRKKDSIITGGLNVYPAEVENAAITLDGVLECAAYGVPDEKWGECVTLSVVVRPGSTLTAEQVIGHCRERIATYKLPKRVDFRDSLPRTPSGKVMRHVLRSETPAR
jgi:fatty-acyl-CoA synthase